jgi:hypothetical protein
MARLVMDCCAASPASETGQKLPRPGQNAMSALPPKAAAARSKCHVRFTPRKLPRLSLTGVSAKGHKQTLLRCCEAGIKMDDAFANRLRRLLASIEHFFPTLQ